MRLTTADIALAIAAMMTGALAIWADVTGRRMRYFLKPLTTATILALALLRLPLRPASGCWIAAGLALSLAGDVLLMLPRERFVAGLASFLLGHCCYVIAFCREAPVGGAVSTILPGLLLLVVLAVVILPRAGTLRWPVLVYGLVIAAMAWRATVRHVALDEARTWLGMAGAWLFCISDLALAWGRFVRRAFWVPILCLGAYYPAQLLIALSI